MEGIKTRGSLAKRNDGQERLVFRRGYHGLDLESRRTDEEEAHIGADVQGHVEERSIENLLYEVSGKHLGTNLHLNCAAVSLSRTVMVPPHFGQTQDETARTISVDRMTGVIPRRWRQRSSDKERW